MNKRIAMLLLLLLAFCAAALAEDAEVESTPRSEALQVALNGRPVSEEPVHLVVGNTTKVSGGFFTTFFGNNTSDIDVRTMLHAYRPTVWDNQIQFVEDPMVVAELTRTPADEGTVFTVRLQPDLLYCDGETRITAEDYCFAWLLSASPELLAIGGEAPEMNVVGFEEYRAGETPVFAGIRLLDELTFSIYIKEDYDVYFYDLAQIALDPYPISVLAPGCAVRDDGEGAYIAAEDGGASPFSADLLRRTILDPETGYQSHPTLTCGPYRLTGYDREAGVVDFEINPYYKGNYEGVKPVIDTVTLVPVLPEDMMDRLASGEVDLLNKCVDASVIDAGMALLGEGEFSMVNYARLGYGFCAFSCEKGPQQFVAVRQALNYAFDSEAFIRDVLGGYGTPVWGYYGIGQWMVGAVNGSFRPYDLSEEETAEWDALTFDRLNRYPLDLDEARRLLIEDGWTLNREGGEFREGEDDVRCKMVDGTLMPLVLKFAKCARNDAADRCVAMFSETLPQIGAALDVTEVPFGELLMDYYREGGERRFDMNFMATNFVSTFDPYLVFRGDPELQGSVNTSGIADEELVRRAWEMRSTAPGDLLTFVRRWLLMQERFNEILPTMPIYGNIYFDFFTSWLQNYHANAEYSWPVAILYAWYGEPVEEEAPSEEALFEDEFEDESEDEFEDEPEAEAPAGEPAGDENADTPPEADGGVPAGADADETAESPAASPADDASGAESPAENAGGSAARPEENPEEPAVNAPSGAQELPEQAGVPQAPQHGYFDTPLDEDTLPFAYRTLSAPAVQLVCTAPASLGMGDSITLTAISNPVVYGAAYRWERWDDAAGEWVRLVRGKLGSVTLTVKPGTPSMKVRCTVHFRTGEEASGEYDLSALELAPRGAEVRY